MEVVLIVVIVSIGIVTVVTGLNSGNKYLQKSREKIIAINLAREGVEQMINIRDSNRRKNAGRKEETRLRTNPIKDVDNRFSSGSYILLPQTSGGQQYFYGTGPLMDFDINQGSSTGNLQYALCQTTGSWQACPGSMPISVEGKFFRRVRGIGLYEKATATNWGDFMDCKTSTDLGSSCKDSTAKEYRFCVIVDYIGNIVGKIELCSVITNFKQ